MKKLNFIFIFLAALAFSCSKDGTLNTNPSTDQLSGNSALNVSGPVIKVYPGSNDTKALTDAFALARTYGKNVVVKLMPGTFTIGMIEIREFNGTFCGSGMGKTIITNSPDVTPDAVIALNKIPALITFIGGDVSVSDMTVEMPEALSWLGNNQMDMLLFSDYSVDFMPTKQHIGVNLNNIEVTGVLNYGNFFGVELSADILNLFTFTALPGSIELRSNIDARVNNSKFSNFSWGVVVWGCKSGNISFGTEGGNIFAGNGTGLDVEENMGVNVKVMNNKFICPANCWTGLYFVTGDQWWGGYTNFPLETVKEDLGNYEIRDNIFNIYYNDNGMVLWDAWRYVHPENPSWMKIICDHNTFNDLEDLTLPLFGSNMKDVVISNNKIAGNAPDGGMYIAGLWLSDTSDPNYWLGWSDNCKILNNIFLQKNFIIGLNNDTHNFLIQGDLTNVTVNDNGVNNKVIGLKNPGHGLSKECMDRIGRMRDDMHNRLSRH
jgi:hypothetical protein